MEEEPYKNKNYTEDCSARCCCCMADSFYFGAVSLTTQRTAYGKDRPTIYKMETFKVAFLVTTVSDRTGLSDIRDIIANRRLSLFGHVRRLPEGTPAHDALRASIDMLSGITPGTHTGRGI